jgi:uncharacterized protein (TIGR00725 family)
LDSKEFRIFAGSNVSQKAAGVNGGQMKRPIIIGVMGGGRATRLDAEMAFDLGRRIAEQGWVLLNGGRRAGIMESSARGAAEAGGITLGILPDMDLAEVSDHVMLPVLTGLGSARNVINVLTSRVVVACRGGAGTVSEVALALKYGRPVVLLNFDTGSVFDAYRHSGLLQSADSPADAIRLIRQILGAAER